MANTDEQVQKLFAIVQQKKKEISKAEKPDWKTNCTFSYSRHGNDRINLQVTSDVDELINMLAFLIEKEKAFNEAKALLGVDNEFKWMGFTFEEWKYDIQTRLTKSQISKKKKELETLETRLNGLISPELKAKWELEEITKLLQ